MGTHCSELDSAGNGEVAVGSGAGTVAVGSGNRAVAHRVAADRLGARRVGVGDSR